METINEVFAEFAAIFVGALDAGQDIHDPTRLDRATLDYSIDSLEAVDTYLTHLHGLIPETGEQDWGFTILCTGGYVGEVIRRTATRPHDWVDYTDFVAEYPNTRELLGDRELPVAAFLSTGDGGFTLPVNKVVRFLEEGPENSVKFYASASM